MIPFTSPSDITSILVDCLGQDAFPFALMYQDYGIKSLYIEPYILNFIRGRKTDALCPGFGGLVVNRVGKGPVRVRCYNLNGVKAFSGPVPHYDVLPMTGTVGRVCVLNLPQLFDAIKGHPFEER